MDVYDKMAQFIVENNIERCEHCIAIEMYGNNDCCDHKEWCIKGIAAYLRRNRVLENKCNRR